MRYLIIFIISALIAVFGTAWMKYLATRWHITDNPANAPLRKKQITPVPLLGGVAVYLSWCLVVAWLFPSLTGGYLLVKYLVGISVAGGVLVLGGVLDDIYQLSPKQQICFPVIASLIIVFVGIGPQFITNPFGDIISLDQWQWTIFSWHDMPYRLTLLADLFTIGWLLVIMYTTKLLDGLDGLVPGITLIGGLIIFFVSISQTVSQPETATLALILSGAVAGFLVWNFLSAKIYLGESGSLFVGFILGILAILSGGKIATALLILGLPLVDFAWVVIRRIWLEHKSPFAGDTLHLHYQLRLLGLSERQIVLLYYFITLLFGVSTLFFTGIIKLIILFILVILAITLLSFTYYKSKNN